MDGSSGSHLESRFACDGMRETTFKQMAGLLGRKWHVTILYQLSEGGQMRFSDLQTEIDGISAKVLSESLQRLESRYGVVRRTIVNDQPLQVEYSLTETGESLQPVVTAILEWGQQNQSLIEEWDREGPK